MVIKPISVPYPKPRAGLASHGGGGGGEEESSNTPTRFTVRDKLRLGGPLGSSADLLFST